MSDHLISREGSLTTTSICRVLIPLMSCSVMSCLVTSSHVISRQVVSCRVMSLHERRPRPPGKVASSFYGALKGQAAVALFMKSSVAAGDDLTSSPKYLNELSRSPKAAQSPWASYSSDLAGSNDIHRPKT